MVDTRVLLLIMINTPTPFCCTFSYRILGFQTFLVALFWRGTYYRLHCASTVASQAVRDMSSSGRKAVTLPVAAVVILAAVVLTAWGIRKARQKKRFDCILRNGKVIK